MRPGICPGSQFCLALGTILRTMSGWPRGSLVGTQHSQPEGVRTMEGVLYSFWVLIWMAESPNRIPGESWALQWGRTHRILRDM